ncbi:peptide ABC transporter substrate-binding protein [Acidianus sulfidivorans JP7]|uniref:Peptide ABC transporter substrate-binding protein n=1 Tax=Acidianus sulfidivorans JP7 TaxID=619593 RepID=A0A2U9ILG0_9CREN|nr:ABC transporter substrate-binding protein [Acidianus sulfidivorans]AWR96889.1 peptide ABC transporter substrate-binding protein [Acidianus sulfidivorans JP7]
MNNSINSNLPKLGIFLILFIVFIISMEVTTPILASSYAISNFNTPILTPSQARISEPWVGKITFIFSYTSHSAEYSALIAGKIDFATLDHVSEIKQAITMYNKTVFVGIAPVESFGQLVFSFNQSLTSNLYFRYAVSSLINTTEITDVVNENGILGVDYPFFVSPKIYSEWFNPEVETYYNQYESYNITRAIQYLEKVPGITHVDGKWYYNGKPLTLTFIYGEDSTPQLKLAEVLQAQFELINITLQIKAEPFGTLIETAVTPPYSFNITTFGWISLGPLVPEWLTIYTSPENVGGFSNSTIDSLIQQAETAPSLSESINLVKQVELDLQEQLPYIIITWSNAIQGVYLPGWANYIYLKDGTSVYSINIANVHPINSTLTGDFIFSSVSGDLPRHVQPYASESLYAFNILDCLYAPLATTPYTDITEVIPPSQLIPILASNWTIKSGVTTTAPNGEPIVNGTILTVNLIHNATWINGEPVTAYDVNFTYWYYDIPGISGTNSFDGIKLNYTCLIDNAEINTDVFGSIPQLVDTQVTNPYQIVFYLNSSSVITIDETLTEIDIFFPASVYSHIQPATIWNDKFAPLISNGPYMWNSSSSAFSDEAFTVTYNSHYARINPLIFLQNVKAGTPYNFTTTFTYYNWDNTTDTLVPTPATGTAYVWLKALDVPGVPYGNYTKPVKMTMIAPGEYSAMINTTGLPAGIYEIVAKIISPGGKEEYSYGSLNVTPVVTTHPPTTTTPVTTTSTHPSSTILYVGIGVVVVIIVIVAALVLLRRR